MNDIRYSIRNISEILDKEIRTTAEKKKLSINQAVLLALNSFFLGQDKISKNKRDLSWFIGKDNIENSFDSELDHLRKVDKEMW